MDEPAFGYIDGGSIAPRGCDRGAHYHVRALLRGAWQCASGSRARRRSRTRRLRPIWWPDIRARLTRPRRRSQSTERASSVGLASSVPQLLPASIALVLLSGALRGWPAAGTDEYPRAHRRDPTAGRGCQLDGPPPNIAIGELEAALTQNESGSIRRPCASCGKTWPSSIGRSPRRALRCGTIPATRT